MNEVEYALEVQGSGELEGGYVELPDAIENAERRVKNGGGKVTIWKKVGEVEATAKVRVPA